VGNHSREDHIERSVTKVKFLDGRNGRVQKSTSLDERVNSQKNTGRKKRDTKVTQKRVAGTAPIGSPTGTAPIGSPTLRRSLRGERTITRSPGMWNDIANGGLKDPSVSSGYEDTKIKIRPMMILIWKHNLMWMPRNMQVTFNLPTGNLDH
jgi:hypothetical protein